jgi:hypothetical protein
MKRTEKQQWRKRFAFSALQNIAGAMVVTYDLCQKGMDGVMSLMRRKRTPCAFQYARATECKLDGRTIDVHGLDPMDAFTRRVVLSSVPVSIAKLVPTLP